MKPPDGTPRNGPRFRSVAGSISVALVALAFLGSAATKLAHVPHAVAQLTHAGLPEGAILPLGILELACLALYLYPRTSILGTFLLTGFMGGAIVVHLIGRDSAAPPLMVGMLMFASSYLRNGELSMLVPLRKMDGPGPAHGGRQGYEEPPVFDQGRARAGR